MEKPIINVSLATDSSRSDAGKIDDSKGDGPRIAHTLAACCRCRQRKTRCDTGLPKCGPCARTNSRCEFWDPAQRKNINRGYVVELQRRVRELEHELAVAETDELEDPECMVRSAACVRIQENDDARFLGPSSGIAMTRLVMQLAKECTGAERISQVVPDEAARHIKDRFAQEEGKPFSKVYPLMSNIAADGLPLDRGLVDRLVHLFNLRVQSMYPIFHEPTFQKDLEAVYAGSKDPYQQFIVRMVIAISLQKVDTQWAGLADSYYLAALLYLEPVVRMRNLKTLQCFCLIGEYSLLTPTRTAVYYIIGLAARLLESLNMTEERTITRTRGGGTADFLEIDMRRRLFWCTWVMDLGLAHSLGRPTMLATSQDSIDVKFFSTADDQFITPDGIVPGKEAPTLRKWIAIHFHKMRLLQLEIRRKLYLKKRDEPKDNKHPWFIEMDGKLTEWRDTSPDDDISIGLDKAWFVGRYNTMVVFLYRPSPQVPRPSLEAARKCFEASEFNIFMHQKQIDAKNVELTWAFTQSIFMAINTVLWSLSYAGVRRVHPKEKVENLLKVSLDAILRASERWPGVASAYELYQNLIGSCMKIYNMGGDLPVTAPSPQDSASPESTYSQYRSRTESPATISTSSLVTPPEAAFGPTYQGHMRVSNIGGANGSNLYDPHAPLHIMHSPVDMDFDPGRPPVLAPLLTDHPIPSATRLPSTIPTSAPAPNLNRQRPGPRPSIAVSPTSSPNIHYRQVAEPEPDPYLKPIPPPAFSTVSPWDKAAHSPIDPFGGSQYSYNSSPLPSPVDHYVKTEPVTDYHTFTQYSIPPVPEHYGLDQAQQSELLHTLETSGVGNIDKMIEESNALFYPTPPHV
ncbi:MAG: hypothetical protein M1820_000558 [Bogoriella megaspora]|nr:MAG: hypothetical protein M1820_000558 [Bogoriella megaspora]